MARVIADMSMSLDGFIADPPMGSSTSSGGTATGSSTSRRPTRTADPQMTFRTSEASARHLREAFSNVGALLTGRRLFDIAGGWGGSHPVGAPVVVLSHSVPDGWPREDAPFTFVTDGLESAVAQAKRTAGEKDVAVASANVAQQCLAAGPEQRYLALRAAQLNVGGD